MIESPFETVKRNILNAKVVFHKEKGYLPGFIDITPEMENYLCAATFQDIGIQVSNLVLYGPRTALKNLYGMTVTWDAKEFKVYGDGDPSVMEEVKLDL